MRPLVHLNECVFHHQCDPLEQYASTLLQHVWGQCRRCEAGLLINQPVQSRRADARKAKEWWSERRVQAWSSPLVEVPEQGVCQALHAAPIGAQGAGFAGEYACRRRRRPAAAPSDSRTLGRRATEIRTGRRIGVETGHWHIRLGPRGGAEAAAASRRGAPSPHVSWLALARGGCWHAACSPQS